MTEPITDSPTTSTAVQGPSTTPDYPHRLTKGRWAQCLMWTARGTSLVPVIYDGLVTGSDGRMAWIIDADSTRRKVSRQSVGLPGKW